MKIPEMSSPLTEITADLQRQLDRWKWGVASIDRLKLRDMGVPFKEVELIAIQQGWVFELGLCSAIVWETAAAQSRARPAGKARKGR